MLKRNPLVPPHTIRRRLWKAGSLVVLFIITLIISNAFVSRERAVTHEMLGHDFLAFYAAGSFARTGEFSHLYDLTAIKANEAATGKAAGLTVGFGPWWNPPFAAWFFAPFSRLPFGQAVIAWEIFGLAAVAVSCLILASAIPGGWQNAGLIPILIFGSGPFWAVITHGQNTFLTLLILSTVVFFWRKRQAIPAGIAAGLLLYKPQHAAVIAAILTLSLGWRAALGFAATALGLVLITIITMPGALGDYVHKLPNMIVFMQEQSDYAWDRHVTLKAFWRLLLQGNFAGPMRWTTWSLWWCSELLVIGMLLRMVQTAWDDSSKTDRLIAAAVIATPLLVPFFFDYDLLILAVAAVCCASDSIRNGLDRPLFYSWTGIFFLMHASNPIAHHTGFNPAAPAMVGMLAILSRPSGRPDALRMALQAD